MPFSEAVVKLLSQPRYQPLSAPEIIRKLRIPPRSIKEFKAFLQQEEEKGRIVCIKNDRYVLAREAGLFAGIIQMTERGFGFVVPDDPEQSDIYVSADNVGTAFHRDHVLVRLKEKRRPRDERRTEGEVIRVLRRARTQLVGTLQKTNLFYYVVPDDAKILHDIYVPSPEPPIPLGYKVVVKLKDWPSRHVNPEGHITEVLGAPGTPGIDILSILRKYDLPGEFPAEVDEEVAEISRVIPASEIRQRDDFRSILTFTIDPDDAKDFDDAISYEKLPNGNIRLYVHIADVSHFVRPGTALDLEAKARGNSVYLVDRVIPMLPEKLSNGICSLQPNEDRLVKTAILELTSKGKVVHHRFASGIIRSQRRFTYQEALSILRDAHSKDSFAGHLKLMNRLAQALRRIRFQEGSLDLDFPEVKVRLDENGSPRALERMENDESHQLIEEFMLLANEAVAAELKKRQVPAIYRIHEKPDPSRLEEFREQVRAMKIPVGNLVQRGEIQKFLEQIRSHPEAGVIKVNLLKSLKRAVYSPNPIGHFGLAKANYTHFTSPIRRYADLIVHRVLFFDKKRQKNGKEVSEIQQLANQLSVRERVAADAENESVKLKKLEFLERESRKESKRLFPAVILEVRSFGAIVEIPQFLISGHLQISRLQWDFFVFNPRQLEWRGKRSGKLLKAGKMIQVMVDRVDLRRNTVDFSCPSPSNV